MLNRLVKLFARLYSLFFTFEEVNPELIDCLVRRGKKIVYATQHTNVIPILLYLGFSRLRPRRRVAFLTSISSEAQLAQSVLEDKLFTVVSRGRTILERAKGAKRVIELIEKEDYSLALTIDEKSKTPDVTEREIAKGAIWFAKHSDSLLVPVSVVCTSNYRHSSGWDNLKIPLPFACPFNIFTAPFIVLFAAIAFLLSLLYIVRVSRISIVYHKPFELDPDKTDEELATELDAALSMRDRYCEASVLSRSRALRRAGAFALLLFAVCGFAFLTLVTPAGLIYVPALTAAFVFFALVVDRSSLRLVSDRDYCDYGTTETKKVLRTLITKSIDANELDTPGEICVVCGGLEKALGVQEIHHGLIRALDSGTLVRVILTDRVPHESTPLLEQLLKYDTFCAFGAPDAHIPHFAVVNRLHVRVEYSHYTGIFSERYAETYFYCKSMGHLYKAKFQRLLSRKGVVRI